MGGSVRVRDSGSEGMKEEWGAERESFQQSFGGIINEILNSF